MQERNYPVEYSCQNQNNESYDLQSHGYTYGYGGDFSTPIQVAFGKCNTAIVQGNSTINGISVQNLSLQVETFDDMSPQWLLNYGLTHSSGGNAHNQNIVGLYAVKDYTDLSQGNVIGISAISSGQQSYAFAFVFVYTIELAYSNNTAEEKSIVVTHTAIHELGHCRQKPDPPNDAAEQLIHNGKNKDLCVMTISPAGFTEETLYFCEGHIQSLMNCYW